MGSSRHENITILNLTIPTHQKTTTEICPKFIAFKGPSGRRERLAPGFYTFQPTHYVSVFRERGVTAVVRLNEQATYNKKDFEREGFRFYDLYFDDCTVPPQEVIEQFLDICDREPGVIAVHCKAGLGRTGTLIAVYLMKNFGLSANACIAWLRIVRPGSVIGPQQEFLKEVEHASWEGNRPVWPQDEAQEVFAIDREESERWVGCFRAYVHTHTHTHTHTPNAHWPNTQFTYIYKHT